MFKVSIECSVMVHVVLGNNVMEGNDNVSFFMVGLVYLFILFFSVANVHVVNPAMFAS